MQSENRFKSIRILDFFKIYKSKIFLMFMIVFSLSLLLFYLPQVSTDLIASSQNIPGTITAILVHKDFTHLGINFLLAFAALLLYSLSSTISGIRHDNFILPAIWFSAILANLVYVIMSPNSSVSGSSGLVSAFLGGVMTFAYISAWNESVQRLKVIQSTIGMFLFITFIVLNLNTNPDINIIVHLMSFSIMVFLVLLKHALNST